VALVLYLMGTPARKRAIKAREAAQQNAEAVEAPGNPETLPSTQPDTGGHAPAAAQVDVIAAVRKEP
jgi:hypothetical protein